MWARPKYERLQNIWQNLQFKAMRRKYFALWQTWLASAPLEEMGPIKIFTTLILFQGEDFFSSKSNEDSKTCVCVGLYFKQQAFHMIMIDRSSICSEKFERLRINKSKVSSQRHHHQMAPVTHAIATLQRLPQKKRQIYIPLNSNHAYKTRGLFQ